MRPTTPVSPVTAQGQLGFGGTYYASNGNNEFPAALFLKQGFARYHFNQQDKNVRIGRFEFFEGPETKPKNPTIAWLQPNRVAQRLVGNFGFTVASAASTASTAIMARAHGTSPPWPAAPTRASST